MLDPVAADLAAWGTVAVIEARGRRSGRVIATPVGFIEEPDGCLLVAASDTTTDWARNLLADPVCRVRVGERRDTYRAEPLDPVERARVISALILRYGTPAERLGAGPAFRLRPQAGGSTA